jgi:hypothetical protein
MNDQFMHHLRDTIILLGGRLQIANLLRNPEALREADVDRLKQYNIDLETRLKNRLADTNKMTIRVRGD